MPPGCAISETATSRESLPGGGVPLKNVEALDDGSVWLRYDVLGPVDDA